MSNHSASEQEFLDKLNKFIETHLENEHYGVSELARDMGMSRSNLHRKVKALTKITASQYLRQFRLKKAMEMLQQTSDRVSEVAYKSGFSSPAYFVKCFHDYYGYSPGGVGNRSDENNEQPSQLHFRKKKLIAIVSAVLILAILLFFAIANPLSIQQNEMERTIAVLPFRNYSPDSSDVYINGLRESIIDNLQKIQDLEVRSRTSVEKYRKEDKFLTDIAKELKVNYIVEGSGLKIGNNIKLTVQLLEANTDKHLISEEYQKEINEVKDYIEIQAEVALDIAKKIKAEITPAEINEIEKLPTENMAAYNQFLRGMDYNNVGLLSQSDKNMYAAGEAYRKAFECIKQATELDSTFAIAYLWLSHFYIETFPPGAWRNPKLQINYLDSGRYLAEKALKYDPENNWALSLMEKYYRIKGMEKEAEIWEKKYLQNRKANNLKDSEWFYAHRYAMADISNDYYSAIKHYYKYLETKPGEVETPGYILEGLYEKFENIGYPEMAKSVAKEILTRNNDSTVYWRNLEWLRFLYEDDNSMKFSRKVYQKDSTNLDAIFRLGLIATWQSNLDEAYYYMQKQKKVLEASGNTLSPWYFYGYIYLQNGFQDEAEKYFNSSIKIYTEQIELNLILKRDYPHANLACIYAIKGERETAMNYLKQMQHRETVLPYLWIKWFKIHPIWDDFRNKPDFQRIIADVERNYEKEHELVGKLLRELGKIE